MVAYRFYPSTIEIMPTTFPDTPTAALGLALLARYRCEPMNEFARDRAAEVGLSPSGATASIKAVLRLITRGGDLTPEMWGLIGSDEWQHSQTMNANDILNSSRVSRALGGT